MTAVIVAPVGSVGTFGQDRMPGRPSGPAETVPDALERLKKIPRDEGIVGPSFAQSDPFDASRHLDRHGRVRESSSPDWRKESQALRSISAMPDNKVT